MKKEETKQFLRWCIAVTRPVQKFIMISPLFCKVPVPNSREKVIDNKLAETYNYICVWK